MIEFRTALEDRLMSIITTTVGTGTDPTHFVRTVDNHIHDFNLTFTPNPWPFMVVAIRSVEQSGQSEVGVPYDLYMWTVHLYYISLDANFNTGDEKRNFILGKLVKKLEEDRFLGGLSSTSGGKRERVYDSTISAVLFDFAGQEEEYSFQSELYLNVYTQRN